MLLNLSCTSCYINLKKSALKIHGHSFVQFVPGKHCHLNSWSQMSLLRKHPPKLVFMTIANFTPLIHIHWNKDLVGNKARTQQIQENLSNFLYLSWPWWTEADATSNKRHEKYTSSRILNSAGLNNESIMVKIERGN